MFHHSRPSRPSRLRSRVAVAALAGALAVSGIAATASAKEIGSGAGGGITTPACNPVTSLTVKADPRVGELGFASVSVSYSVKPCVNGQVVTVTNSVAEYLDPTSVIYDNPDAPLNGKFLVGGVKLRTTYKVTIDVIDAATGLSVGSLSAYTAAVPKGV